MSKNKDSKIADIQKFKEMKESINQMETLLSFSPFLKMIGVDLSDVENQQNLSELKEEAYKLIGMPDKFNRIFAERGWIAYENLNADVAKEAIKISQNKSLEEAEKYLADYYNEENLGFHFMSMKAIEAFRIRYDLLQKAKEDYLEKRFYATAPIILSSLDGIVNDVAKKNRGFFAEDIEIEMEAWNSISAHSEGLGKLVNLLQSARNKTSKKEITVPFRHGILHGRDIEFDNKIIAAKSWAALFSIRDWALSVKHNREPQEKVQPTWGQLQKQIQETNNLKSAIEKWKPRPKETIQEIIKNKRYEEGTSEAKVAEFMKAWEEKNYGAMFEILPTNIKNLKTKSKEAGRMREKFEDHQFINFRMLEIDEIAPATCKIKVAVKFDFLDKTHENKVTYQLLFLDKNGNSRVYGNLKGQWGFTPEMY